MAVQILPALPLYQIRGDTSPAIGVTVSGASIDGVACRWVHSLWGEIDVVAVGNEVTLPITSPRATIPLGTYTYHLVINPGVPGAEETVARGPWTVIDRDGSRT